MRHHVRAYSKRISFGRPNVEGTPRRRASGMIMVRTSIAVRDKTTCRRAAPTSGAQHSLCRTSPNPVPETVQIIYPPPPPLSRQQTPLARGPESEGSVFELGATVGGGVRSHQHGRASAREDQKTSAVHLSQGCWFAWSVMLRRYRSRHQ